MLEYSWVPASNGAIPEGAFVSGRHKDGLALYSARAEHLGNIVPGKAKLSHGAYIGWGGYEFCKDQYEVLVCDDSAVSWVFDRDGHVPERAIEAGHYVEKNEILYLGRALHNNSITIGKVHPSYNCMFLPYNQREVTILEYEVLVYNNNGTS